MTITLQGHVPGKKNLLRVSRHRGIPALYRDKSVVDEIAMLTAQARAQWRGRALEHPEVAVRFFVRNRRADRDNKLTTVLDCLQQAGVIHQDNVAWFNGEVRLLPAVVTKEGEKTVIEISGDGN